MKFQLLHSIHNRILGALAPGHTDSHNAVRPQLCLVLRQGHLLAGQQCLLASQPPEGMVISWAMLSHLFPAHLKVLEWGKFLKLEERVDQRLSVEEKIRGNALKIQYSYLILLFFS